MKQPRIDYDKCMACRVCITACPFSCLEETLTGAGSYPKAYPELIRDEDCTGCSICAQACPIEVIQMVGE